MYRHLYRHLYRQSWRLKVDIERVVLVVCATVSCAYIFYILGIMRGREDTAKVIRKLLEIEGWKKP